MSSIKQALNPFAKESVEVFPYDDMKYAEFRMEFSGSVRKDTRSSVGVNTAETMVKQATIRLPPTTGEMTDLQSKIILIGKRTFGEEVGCYVRDAGSRIHLKYPASGTIGGYPVEEFTTDLEKFKNEIEQKQII